MNVDPKEQVRRYELRWPMEKINRTTKQKFGSEQCQALKASKQKVHILAGFLAHSILELSENSKQQKSVDELVNFIRKNHLNDLVSLVANSKTSKNKHNIELDAKIFQNQFQNFPKNNEYCDVLKV